MRQTRNGVVAGFHRHSQAQGARRAAGQGDDKRFHEIYLSASIEVCEGRDPKG
ncbi:MAG: adenylyl-sulfate kinase, partial [Acidobacteria bacterium]|nr:adenylyl-sulfate kinase [Acidobacteriota bacterium]